MSNNNKLELMEAVAKNQKVIDLGVMSDIIRELAKDDVLRDFMVSHPEDFIEDIRRKMLK